MILSSPNIPSAPSLSTIALAIIIPFSKSILNAIYESKGSGAQVSPPLESVSSRTLLPPTAALPVEIHDPPTVWPFIISILLVLSGVLFGASMVLNGKRSVSDTSPNVTQQESSKSPSPPPMETSDDDSDPEPDNTDENLSEDDDHDENFSEDDDDENLSEDDNDEVNSGDDDEENNSEDEDEENNSEDDEEENNSEVADNDDSGDPDGDPEDPPAQVQDPLPPLNNAEPWEILVVALFWLGICLIVKGFSSRIQRIARSISRLVHSTLGNITFNVRKLVRLARIEHESLLQSGDDVVCAYGEPELDIDLRYFDSLSSEMVPPPDESLPQVVEQPLLPEVDAQVGMDSSEIDPTESGLPSSLILHDVPTDPVSPVLSTLNSLLRSLFRISTPIRSAYDAILESFNNLATTIPSILSSGKSHLHSSLVAMRAHVTSSTIFRQVQVLANSPLFITAYNKLILPATVYGSIGIVFITLRNMFIRRRLEARQKKVLLEVGRTAPIDEAAESVTIEVEPDLDGKIEVLGLNEIPTTDDYDDYDNINSNLPFSSEEFESELTAGAGVMQELDDEYDDEDLEFENDFYAKWDTVRADVSHGYQEDEDDLGEMDMDLEDCMPSVCFIGTPDRKASHHDDENITTTIIMRSVAGIEFERRMEKERGVNSDSDTTMVSERSFEGSRRPWKRRKVDLSVENEEWYQEMASEAESSYLSTR